MLKGVKSMLQGRGGLFYLKKSMYFIIYIM